MPHSPGNLRESFLQWVEDYDVDNHGDTIVVGYDQDQRPLRWLIGQLWNCTDVVPFAYCDILEMHQGSTFAQAVRRVSTELN